MAAYVFVPGAGDSPCNWQLAVDELRARGHEAVAVDLPCEDESAGLWDYADAVVEAVDERDDVIVVAHSLGGFVAPLVCTRMPVRLLVLVAAMVPAPGEPADDWGANTGYESPTDDEMALVCHDVPPDLAAAAAARWRGQAATPMREPWPLDAWPQVPTRFLLCRDDRRFAADRLRGVVRERLGIDPDEVDGGHCPFLSRPGELAERLEAYRAELAALDFYDVELRRHNPHLRAGADVRRGERVLDIGCGTGQSAREAARAAAPGRVLGVDISPRMLERARQLAAAEGLDNLTFVEGDAETHPFELAHYDLAISRFGTMFFSDPVAAFANIARALRSGGRLALLVWQRPDRNEWATVLDLSPEPFSLGDPDRTARILERAGFRDVRFDDVHEPVFLGRDASAALAWVRRFASVDDDLRAALAAHHSPENGVLLDSRAWLVRATTSA